MASAFDTKDKTSFRLRKMRYMSTKTVTVRGEITPEGSMQGFTILSTTDPQIAFLADNPKKEI